MIETLYRKYRPKNFDEIVGQSRAVTLLKSFASSPNPPQSIILTGTRGVGKTTLARIVAHELGVNDMDIYELDAASNNGVDEMREIVQGTYAMPMMSSKKVYIFDEVHMFSNSTWSVLLKVLEEPPAHVIFIMATTDDYKIPDTIISRSSVVTLVTPSRDDIIVLLQKVAQSESILLDQDSLDVLVVSADGAFRNALVALETVIRSANGQIITAELISGILSLPPLSFVRTLVHHIAYPSKEIEQSIIPLEQYDALIVMRLIMERIRMIMEFRFGIISSLPKNDQELVEKIARDITGSKINAKLLSDLLKLEIAIAESPSSSMIIQAYFFELLESVQ